MTAQQKELIATYKRIVSTVFKDLEELKTVMNTEAFKDIVDTYDETVEEDENVINDMGTVYGSFNAFIQDLPSALNID